MGGVAVPAQYQPYVNQAAQTLGISPSIVAAQIFTESSFNPNAVSPTGAQGIAQFEPYTWSSYGTGSPFNVSDAFAAYTKYMGDLLREENGNIQNALAAYNAGPGNLSAGMGYATSILSLAGQPNGGTSTASSNQGSASGASDQQTGWVQNLFGWLTGQGPLQALEGGSSSLVGAVGSAIEQGLFTAFWDIFKKIFDTLLKPVFWVWELTQGVVLMIAGLAVLAMTTKIGQTAASAVSLVPGPVGAVGKGAAVLGGVSRAAVGGSSPARVRSDISRPLRGAGRTEPARAPRSAEVTKSTGEKATL